MSAFLLNSMRRREVLFVSPCVQSELPELQRTASERPIYRGQGIIVPTGSAEDNIRIPVC